MRKFGVFALGKERKLGATLQEPCGIYEETMKRKKPGFSS